MLAPQCWDHRYVRCLLPDLSAGELHGAGFGIKGIDVVQPGITELCVLGIDEGIIRGETSYNSFEIVVRIQDLLSCEINLCDLRTVR